MMLLVGFDSAWTPNNAGAIVGVLCCGDGTYRELGKPCSADYVMAENIILRWQAENQPAKTVVMLDQPTIVTNANGQRPVENIVGATISRRYGGLQPANTSRKGMFDRDAPIWRFLKQFGPLRSPLEPLAETQVFETYPVLAIIALGWVLPDARRSGRLPKYNPGRKRTFSVTDWHYVCKKTSEACRDCNLLEIAEWIDIIALKTAPLKSDQDGLDSCVCLLVALHIAERRACLMIGNDKSGYMVVPHNNDLLAELHSRCLQTGRVPSEWLYPL